MWFCSNCDEQNNPVGTSECMVCGAEAPRTSARVQKKSKTATPTPAAAAVPARGGPAWRGQDTLLVFGEPPSKEGGKVCAKVAAFDLDSTLVVPRSGAKFARDAKDWQWLDARVPHKLREFAERGFFLLVVSNQAGVEKQQTTEAAVKGRVEAIAAALGVPVTFFLSCASDQYRKPSPVMWERFLAEYYPAANGAKLQISESFYCGDAAGRPKNWAPGKPRDFACSDRMFAANAGLNFFTPEEIFFGEKPTPNWHWGAPNPRDFLAKYENAATVKIIPRIGKSLAEKELVVLVGLPASGKSSVAKSVFESAGFFRANNDDMGSKAKSMKLAAAALAAGQSVVVDNTNPDLETRREWIELGKKHGVTHFRCFHFATPREVADHLNLLREMTVGRKRIPGVAFNSYVKRFAKPSVAEGFDAVETVPFALRFESDRHRALFLMWQN